MPEVTECPLSLQTLLSPARFSDIPVTPSHNPFYDFPVRPTVLPDAPPESAATTQNSLLPVLPALRISVFAVNISFVFPVKAVSVCTFPPVHAMPQDNFVFPVLLRILQKTAANLSAIRQFSQSFHPIRPASAAPKVPRNPFSYSAVPQARRSVPVLPEVPNECRNPQSVLPLCGPVPQVLPFPVPNRKALYFLPFGLWICLL